jgi:hypothetical protein
MILDARHIENARGYTILDAATGRCLDKEHIFYADSDLGFYRRYLTDEQNNTYWWDRRTRQKATMDTPDRFREVAWTTVRRSIAIFKKESS